MMKLLRRINISAALIAWSAFFFRGAGELRWRAPTLSRASTRAQWARNFCLSAADGALLVSAIIRLKQSRVALALAR